MNKSSPAAVDFAPLVDQIGLWGRELGFQQVAITDLNVDKAADQLHQWLARGYHGSMAWMAERALLRRHPDQLVPGARRAIVVRMDYLPADSGQVAALKNHRTAYISRYALGRDYHKLIRKRLAELARRIEQQLDWQAVPDETLSGVETVSKVQQRPFVDSAPVLEKPLAAKAGLGWVGKNTLILNPSAGSWFFLGVILTSLPLPTRDHTEPDQCGSCSACLNTCPTDAFPEPYVLDARRCISYLTIENRGAIPEEFRQPMGNRVFGCDDCQIVCPWNRHAPSTQETDFLPRHKLDSTELADLFVWSEDEFLERTAGSPIRRIGHEGWLRNLAVGLGNAPSDLRIQTALHTHLHHASEMVREHVAWALKRQLNPSAKRRRKIRRDELPDS